MGDVVGDAAEEEAAGAGHALVADDDQVGLGLFGDVEDGLGGIGLDRVGLHLHPLLAGCRGSGLEDEVDVLAGADLILDVSRGVVLLAIDLAFRQRLVSADDAELGAGQLGQVDRLANRLSSGIRPVGSNHDASEHAASLAAVAERG